MPIHEPQQGDVLSVSALTEQVQGVLRVTFDDVWVRGEVSQPRTPASGHMYLTLKDEQAVLPAVVWRSALVQSSFRPADGDEVLARGYVDVYPPHGRYQFIVRHLEPLGAGALQRKFEQLKVKLAAQGLFDRDAKRPIPLFPRRIALITSKSGAAVRDMIKVIHRRYAPVTLVLLPVRVQGATAAGEIARAFARAERLGDIDVIVAGRGGGSLEDLWAFNEEVVARAIFACEIPVVSAVGHESDVTIADLVADVRAATPSHAGELVVPDGREVAQQLAHLTSRVRRSLRYRLDFAWQQVEALAERPVVRDARLIVRARRERLNLLAGHIQRETPQRRVENRLQRVAGLAARLGPPLRRRLLAEAETLARMRTRLSTRSAQIVPQRRAHVGHLERTLESLSPTAILRRGYSITTRVELSGGSNVVRASEEVSPGDRLLTRLGDGSEVRSRVEPPDA